MIYINEFAPQLGNRLFQLAAAYNLANRNMDNVYYTPSWKYNQYFPNIHPCKEMTYIDNYYQEPYFHYKEIPYYRNLSLTGYFQSEKYFKESEKQIRTLFKINPSIQYTVEDEMFKSVDAKITCSIHVRRGDYLTMPEYHPVLDMNYYHTAISIMQNKYDNVRFFIFSDDLDWCKNQFPNSKEFAIMDMGVVGDFVGMSSCSHNIIANSSFSWWAAWLNPNKNKFVIAPKQWFGPAYYYHNTQDLIPQNWITL